MSTADQHHVHAERLLTDATNLKKHTDAAKQANVIAAAEVHATLAVADTLTNIAGLLSRIDEWAQKLAMAAEEVAAR